MGHNQARYLALMCVYLIISRVTRAAGAVPISVGCPSRVVTNEDEPARVVLLGAWVRGGGVGNGTEAGTDDRHPSIASLRITSNPDHGALYWRARPVLVGDADPVGSDGEEVLAAATTGRRRQRARLVSEAHLGAESRRRANSASPAPRLHARSRCFCTAQSKTLKASRAPGSFEWNLTHRSHALAAACFLSQGSIPSTTQ